MTERKDKKSNFIFPAIKENRVAALKSKDLVLVTRKNEKGEIIVDTTSAIAAQENEEGTIDPRMIKHFKDSGPIKVPAHIRELVEEALKQ